MGVTITKLKMWKNPGYTKGCVEVPPVGSWKLPTPDYTSTTNLRPRKNGTITAIELPLSFCQVFDMSYLYMEFSDSSNRQVKVFGWIESIEQTASSDEAVLIKWDVDWWRTYAGSVSWGYGNITKCSLSTYRRPSPTRPRFWKVKHSERLINPGGDYDTLPFCITIAYNTVVSGSITEITYAYWLCSLSGAEIITVNGETLYSLSLVNVFRGVIDEALGIKAENISGIFITPVAPFQRSTASIITHTWNGMKWFAYVMPSVISFETFTKTFTNTYESDDNLKTVIVDPNGAIVYTLPWGYDVKSVTMGIDAGTVSSDIRIRLLSASEGTIDSASEGKSGSIPAITVPLNSNAISSYLYSGQREYDIEMRNIQRDQQTVAGLQNITGSMIGGSIAGAMTGKSNAVGGALVGASSSLINTAFNWASSGIFNDRLQKATDKLISNQASNVIQSGGGIAFLNNNISPGNWYIVQLEADTTSKDEYDNHIARNGYDTDLSDNLTTYISNTGALQVTDLNLTGSIPPQAKQYIKNILENGIYIVENNPTGVVP